jgi:thioesterase domain-containing protein
MAARLCNGTATHAQDIVQMGGAGGESALFLFAGGAGFLHELTDLVRALHVPGTIYGVASAGADGRDVEIETHQQEGARAAALIRGVRPYGPYHIAGYSLGGSTALETARILRNAGEDVHLIMLDSGLNEHCWPLPVWLKYIAGRAIGRLKRRPSTGEAARVRLPDLAPVKRGKMFQFRFLDPRHPDYPYHSPHWQSCHPPVYTRVRARAIVMRGLYRPLPYEGKVTFFSSAGGDTMACSPSQAWSKYLPNAEWMTTPGNHASMIMGRHAKQLAAGMVSHLTRGKMPIQRREAAQPAEAQGWGEMAGLPQPA